MTIPLAPPSTAAPRRRRSAARRNPAQGVQWFVPGRKTAIGSSTVATSNLIGLLAEDGLTFTEAIEAINYDPEARELLTLYVRRGFGDVKMIDLGVRYG